MTDQEMRVVIAEACGWHWGPGHVTEFGATEPYPIWHSTKDVAHRSIPPDYPNDLNAMHQAEPLLVQNNIWPLYIEYLRRPFLISSASTKQRQRRKSIDRNLFKPVKHHETRRETSAKNMTDTEINIAIANSRGTQAYNKPTEREIKSGSYYQYEPNYHINLNAMHDVIMARCEASGSEFQAVFQLRLQEVIERRRPKLDRERIGFWMNNANARQRAEALLKTLGKWKDSTK